MTTAVDLGSAKVGALTPLSETTFTYERFRHNFGEWVRANPDRLSEFESTEAFQDYLKRLKKLLSDLEDIKQVVATAAYRYLPQGEFQRVIWRECGLFPLTISIEHEGELLTKAIQSRLSKASGLIGPRFVHLHVGGLSTEITFNFSEHELPIQLGFEHLGFNDTHLLEPRVATTKIEDSINLQTPSGSIRTLMTNLPEHTSLVVSGRIAREIAKDCNVKTHELSVERLKNFAERYEREKGEDAKSKEFLAIFLLKLADLGGFKSVIVSDARMAMGQIQAIRASEINQEINFELLRRAMYEFIRSLPNSALTREEIELISTLGYASTKKIVPVVTTLEILKARNDDLFTSPVEELFLRNHFEGIPRVIQEGAVRGIQGGKDCTARKVSKLVRLIIKHRAKVYLEDSKLIIKAKRPKLFDDPKLKDPFDIRKLEIRKL